MQTVRVREKCAICKQEITEAKHYVISKFEKEISSFSCPKCGQIITIERNVRQARVEVKKICKCDLYLTDEMLEDSEPKWNKKDYVLCEKCFKENFSSVLFIELGDD